MAAVCPATPEANARRASERTGQRTCPAYRVQISRRRAVTARGPSGLSLRSAPALHTYHRPAKDTSRLGDIAASLGITARSACGIVAGLAEAGYIVRQKDGRRNRHQIQAHPPLPEPTRPERAVGEFLALLAGTGAGPGPTLGGRTTSRRRPGKMPPQAGRLVKRRRAAPEP
jgi:hypothetical protein